ncbi:RidA family protein [Mycolicibacterium baixiangningiae]|uniref:RidA family protein n=1 Tax=Mycolicibacterium baixiangningiae TaxID=2761578 RepID=UPI0018D05739|nr:RidA family protein [Mycolicibacterium baixiangningiae]
MSYASSESHTVEAILDERVLVSDGLVFVSGLTAADPGTGIPEKASVSTEFPYYGADIQKQTTYLLEKLTRLLEAHGCRLEDVVKTQVFITDCRLFDAFDQVWKRFFPVPPPRTTVGVGTEAMAIPGALVSVDVIAARPDVLDIRHLDSPRLPKPLANYTPCVAAGDWLFLAGQLPTEFGATGLAPAAQVNPSFPQHFSPFLTQAKYTIGVCRTLLEDSGSDWDHVVRVHVFLKNMADAPLFEALWEDTFDGAAPPHLVLGVEELLTGGAQIEIDVIAVRTGTAMAHAAGNVTAPAGQSISTRGLGSTRFSVAQVEVGESDHRLFAVSGAVRAALECAAAQAGDNAEPLKVHAFLPQPTDVYAFGRVVLDTAAAGAAITTSPSVGASNLDLEIVYRVGA